jgi:MT0933-like antitoxin protein
MSFAIGGYHPEMPDLSDLEHEAEDHSTQVDEAIEKGDQEADRLAGGRDHGLIDKGAQEAEKRLGNAEGPGNQGAADKGSTN